MQHADGKRQTDPRMGWRFFLGSAESARQSGDLLNAENYYKQALEFAEHCQDNDVSLAVVLLDMAEFYDANGLPDHAAPIWARVKDALAKTLDQDFAQISAV